MYKVTAEGTRFFYFTNPDVAALQSDLPLHADVSDSLAMKTASSKDVRVGLFEKMLFPKLGQFYYIYWPNGQDLIDLDQRVSTGTISDEDTDLIDALKFGRRAESHRQTAQGGSRR